MLPEADKLVSLKIFLPSTAVSDSAAAVVPALDVYITNTSSLSGLSPDLQVSAYEELSSFISKDSGSYRVRITSSGNQSNVLFDFTDKLNLSSKAVLTLVIVPRASGSLPNMTALAEQSVSALMSNALVS